MKAEKILIELKKFISKEIKETNKYKKIVPFEIEGIIIDDKILTAGLSVYITIKKKIEKLENE